MFICLYYCAFGALDFLESLERTLSAFASFRLISISINSLSPLMIGHPPLIVNVFSRE